MTNVLVVDDSPVDRNLVGGLLEKSGNFHVRYARDGQDALESIQRSVPDIVITDLIMSGMDGLELVHQIRKRFPMIPTVLMTSQGNEDIAVDALQTGAASYVPKHSLASDLLETLESVVEVASHQRCQSRLMDFMVRNEFTFALENDRSLVAPLVGMMQDNVKRLRICNESEQMRVGIALDEAIVNALIHGNLEVGSELREGDGNAYHQVIQQRLSESPFSDRRVHVDVKLTCDEAVFEVRDEGPGFDPSSLPDPTDPSNLDKVSGRGILLMRTFMDEVQYNDVGNCVRLTKRRNPCAESDQTE